VAADQFGFGLPSLVMVISCPLATQSSNRGEMRLGRTNADNLSDARGNLPLSLKHIVPDFADGYFIVFVLMASMCSHGFNVVTR